MDSLLASLAGWFSTRPRWLQIAAARILQYHELTDNDFSELVILCKQEAEGKIPQTACSFPVLTFTQRTTGNLSHFYLTSSLSESFPNARVIPSSPKISRISFTE